MDASVEQKIDQIQVVLSKLPVKSAYLFGSAVNGTYGSTSDIDFFINLDSNIPISERHQVLEALRQQLATATGRHADVVTREMIHNPYVKEEVICTAVKIYG